MFFSNLKIGTRLWMGFGLMFLVMASIVVTAVMQMQAMGAATGDVARAAQNELIALKVVGGINNMRRYQLSALASAGEDRMKELGRVSEQGKENAKLAEELEKSQRHAETKQLAAQIKELNEKYARGNDEVIKLGREDKADAMKVLVQGDERKSQRAALAEGEKFVEIQESRKADALKAAAEAHARAEAVMYSLLMAALVLAFIVALWITRSIVRPLFKAVAAVELVAKGDLTREIEVRTRDETGQLLVALQNMQLGLRETVNVIKSTSNVVSTAAQEIAQGHTDLANRTEEQASSLEETAASMEQMTATVSQNAENARKASVLATGA